MLIRLDTLRERLHGVVLNKGEQGYDIKGLQDELDKLPDSYDEFVKFTEKLLNLKIRNDWSYVEPSSINDILNEMDPSRPKGKIKEIDYEDSSKRVEAAFIASLYIKIFLLFFFTQSFTFFPGSNFFGHPILNLNENFIEAAIKLSKTLFESPIQEMFNLDIGFFLISSTVKISDKT